MSLSARVQFTGVTESHIVSGEYILATDERVAAAACGLVAVTAASAEVEAVSEDLAGYFSELLNTIVGEAILDLDEMGWLKVSTPHICYGKMSFGSQEFYKVALQTAAGQIQCHLHCEWRSPDPCK